MNPQLGGVVGIARPIPDVATFVTPVFSDSNGEYVVQEIAGGRVVGFQPVVLGEEFQSLTCRIAVHIGDPPIYGFESVSGDLLMSPAHLLSSVLPMHPEFHDSSAPALPYTRAAILRFMNSVAGSVADSELPCPYVMRFRKPESATEFVAWHLVKEASYVETIEQLKDPTLRQAKDQAKEMIVSARAQIEQEINAAKESLRKEVVALAVEGAEKVLLREVDASAHREELTKLASKLQ